MNKCKFIRVHNVTQAVKKQNLRIHVSASLKTPVRLWCPDLVRPELDAFALLNILYITYFVPFFIQCMVQCKTSRKPSCKPWLFVEIFSRVSVSGAIHEMGMHTSPFLNPREYDRLYFYFLIFTFNTFLRRPNIF